MESELLLARVQFGLNIGFHILFPSVNVALAWILVYFRVMYARTGSPAWLAIFNFWTKIFALAFAMGIVTGVVMSFQFGTNWPGYMNHVGNVAGPLLAYEVLTAFFLEATFLGVMLFGMNRVPGWVHITATLLVALGTTLSAFWILALNSWMQTPTGHAFDGQSLIAGSWLQVILNPSFPFRFSHMVMASGVTASFLIAGLSAWRLLRDANDATAYRTLRIGVTIAAFLTPTQVLIGDLHGVNTFRYQPAKIAAMEALWETRRAAPFTIFAVPNADERRNDYAIEIPRMGSLLLTHDPDGEVRGLNEFAPDIPPVGLVFYSFRVMVGIGFLMVALSWFGVLRMRADRPPRRWLLWTFSAFTFSGWIAVIAGWITTEVGRQPWMVTGVLRTADAVGSITGAGLGASLTGYIVTYSLLLVSFMVVLTHLAGKGSGHAEPIAAVRRGPGA